MAEKRTSHYDKWVKTFSRMVGDTTKGVLQEVTPNLSSTVRSASQSLQDTRTYINQAKSGLNFQSRTLETTRMGRSAKDIMNSAFSDLRNGSYSLKNLSNDSYDADIDTDSDSYNTTGTDTLYESKKNTAILGKVVAEGNAATIEGLRQMTETLANVTLKSNEASSTKMANLALFGVNKLSSDLGGIQHSLNNVNSNLAALIKFENTNTKMVQEATLNYYDKSLKMFDEIGRNLNAMRDASENMQRMSNKKSRWDFDKFDVQGGMNFGNYAKYVKKNFDNSLYGSMLSMIKTTRDMGVGFGPKDMATKAIAALIPKTIKKSLESLDKNSDRYIKNLLYKVGDLGDYSNPNMITQFIGEMFGMKRPKVGKVNMGDFKKDYMGWNGVAQKTLVEVIPSYLANIEAALTRQDKRHYDASRGTFKTEKQLSDQFMREYQSKIEFSMMTAVDKITKGLNGTNRSSEDKSASASRMSDIINDRVNGKRKNDKSYNSEMRSLLKDLPTKEVREIMLDLEDSIRDAVENINDMNRSIEDDISGSAYRHLFNTEGRNTNHLRRDPNVFAHGRFTKSGRSYDFMSVDEIRKAEADERREKEIKDKVKGISTRFKRRSGVARGQGVADKIESADDLLYSLYEKTMSGELGGKDIGKLFKRSGSASSSSDKDIISVQNDINTFDSSKLRDMTKGEVDKLMKKTSRVMGHIQKESKSSSEARTPKNSNEAMLMIANDSVKNTKTLQGLVGGLFTSITSIFGGIFGKNGIIGKFLFNDTVKKTMSTLKKKFFDENDGLFAPLVQHFKDGIDSLKYTFTGKGYKDRQGKTFSDTNDSVFGYLKNGYEFIFNNTMKHMFGNNFEKDESYNKYFKWMNTKNRRSNSVGEPTTNEERAVQEEIFGSDVGSNGKTSRLSQLGNGSPRDKVEADLYSASEDVAEDFKEAGGAFTETMFGNDSQNKDKMSKEVSQSFFKKFKKNLPKLLTAGVVGGAVGLATGVGGAGVLGSLFLPQGIIGGTIAAMGLQLASKSHKVQEFIFGKEDETGDRVGGLISKKTSATFKKLLPAIVGGATLGALKHVIFGGGVGGSGFLLGSLLPGGIIGGALLGVGASLLKNNEKFNRILFGKKADADGSNDGTKTTIAKGFTKFNQMFSKSSHFIKGGAKGLGIGAITGLTLSNLGVIGSALSLGGPVGMGLAGLGVGIASQTQRFQELLFGTKEIGPDGKPTGKVFKDGIMSRVRNMLVLNVFEPIKDKLDMETTKFAYWAKDKITYPFRLAFGPILDSMKDFKDDIGDFVKEKFEKLTDGIGAAMHNGLKKIFNPFTQLVGKVGKGIVSGLSFTAKMALAPVTGPLGLLSMLTGGRRTSEKVGMMKGFATGGYNALKDKWAEEDANGDYGTGIMSRIRRMAGHATDIKDAYRVGKSAWDEQMTAEGRNSLNWRGVKAERAQDKIDLKDEKTTGKAWSKVNRLRQQFANHDDYKQVNWSDDYANKMRKKFVAAGVDVNWVRSEDDLRDLIYNRTKWRDKFSAGEDATAGSGTLKLNETPEQIKAREKTSYFQDAVLDRLDMVAIAMRESAGQYSSHKKRSEGAKEVARAKRALKKQNMSIADLGLGEEELSNYSNLPSYAFDEYRDSEFYQNKDFKGWYGRYSSKFNGSSASPNEAIIEMGQNLNEKLDEQNAISTGIVEATTNGAWDPKKKKLTDKQAKDAYTSADEISAASSKSMLSGLTAFWSKKNKQAKKDARNAQEVEESKKAQSLDFLSKDDEAILTGEGSKDESSATIEGTGSNILGKIGGIFNWFTSGKNWLKLLAGAGVSYLFKDQILDATEALPELAKKYGPKIQSAISSFMDKYGAPIVEAATATITSLMPTLIGSAFTIVKSMFTTVFSQVATSLGFNKTDTVSSTEAAGLDLSGTNYINNGDGTLTVPGARTLVNSDGTLSSVKNSGLMSAGGKLIRNMVTSESTAKNVAKLASKSASAIGSIVTAPMRLLPGGKIVSKVVSKGAGAAVNVTAKAGNALLSAATSTSGKQRLVKWCMGVFDKFDSLTKNPKILKVIDGSVFGKAINKLKDLMMKGLTKADDSLLTKLAAKAANGTAKATGKLAATTTLILPAMFAVYDAATGAMEAENLFGIDSDEVDWKMRIISSLMKTILGFGVGPFIDILFEIGQDLTGLDFKREFANFLYDLMSNDDDVAKLKANQEKLEIETKNYNDAKGTNLTDDAYNDLKNSPWWKKAWNWITGKEAEDFSKYESSTYSSQAINETSSGNVNVVGYGRNRASNGMMTKSVGYGRRSAKSYGRKPVGYGTIPVLGVSQSDPRWANYPLGTFSDGSISTMATGGCGPTALSMVSSALNGKNYDPLNVARYAKSKGYLSQGGANEDLFTKGAEGLGLSQNEITASGVKSAVKSGYPVILSGKSSGASSSGSPYTRAGHIVVASDYNTDTGKVVISDPMYGYSEEKKISDVTHGMTHGWTYKSRVNKNSAGYGTGSSPWTTLDPSVINMGNSSASVSSYTNKTSKTGVPYNNYYMNTIKNSSSVSTDNYANTASWSSNRIKQVRWQLFNAKAASAAWAKQSKTWNSLSNKSMTTSEYNEAVRIAKEGIGNGDPSKLTAAQKAVIRALTGGGSIEDIAFLFSIDTNPYDSVSAKDTPYWAGKKIDLTISIDKMSPSNLTTYYKNGFNLNDSGVVNWQDATYYIGITVDDIYNLAKKDNNLVTTAYPVFLELYRKFYNRITVPSSNPYSSMTEENVAIRNTVIDESTINSVLSRISIQSLLGGYGISESGYEYKNGIPFFRTDDSRWSKLSPWRGSTVGKRGGDLASLAMIASTFGGSIIPPDYIYKTWLPAHKNWYSSSGLTSSAFMSNGFRSMSSTFVGGNKLNVRTAKNPSTILEALKARKPVFMTGYRYSNSLFGGSGDSSLINSGNPDNLNSLVALYGTDDSVVVNDPFTSASDYSIFDATRLSDTVGKSKMSAIKSAYIISNPDGSGLSESVDMSGKSTPGTKHKKLSDYSGIDMISALISNFVSMGENLIKSKMSGNTYQSIYDTTLDGDTYTPDSSSSVILPTGTASISTTNGVSKPSVTLSGPLKYMNVLPSTGGGNKKLSIGYGDGSSGQVSSLEDIMNRLTISYKAGIASHFGEDYESAKQRIAAELYGTNTTDAASSSSYSGSIIDLAGITDAARAASKIIFSNEGNYASINGNDNGSVSIGKLQWHGSRAKSLLRSIRNYDSATFDSIAKKNNATKLISDINGSDAWKTYKMYSNTPIYNATKGILATSASKYIQDTTALSDVQKYINAGRIEGLTDSRALIYYADFANQYGAGSSALATITRRAIANGGSLDAMYNATVNYFGINGDHMSRRTKVYNSIKSSYVTSSSAHGSALAYGTGPDSSSNPVSWFTNTLRGRVTSGYGYRGKSDYHRGLDIGADKGATIKSPIDGSIVENGYDALGYGNYAVVQDSSGYNHIFAHLNSKSSLPVGYGVHRNAIIGTVGNTGNSNGSHLHYEIRTGNSSESAINPSSFAYGDSADHNSLSKSLNINRTASQSLDSISQTENTGNGNKDISNEILVKKLDVAVNTKNVEDKLDTLIDVVKIMATSKSSGNSTATTNNYVGYGNGSSRQQNGSSGGITVLQQKSNSDTADYSSMGIRSIHDLLAKRN